MSQLNDTLSELLYHPVFTSPRDSITQIRLLRNRALQYITLMVNTECTEVQAEAYLSAVQSLLNEHWPISVNYDWDEPKLLVCNYGSNMIATVVSRLSSEKEQELMSLIDIKVTVPEPIGALFEVNETNRAGIATLVRTLEIRCCTEYVLPKN